MRLFSFLVGLLFFLPWPAAAAELSPQLQRSLQIASAAETIPIIVTFAAEADLRQVQKQAKTQRRTGVVKALRETADLSQRQVGELLKGRGKKFQELWIVNGLALDASPELIAQLAARPEVAAIELDGTIELPQVLPSQLSTVEWNIAAVRAPDLWSRGFTGQGVTIAILDSGVDLTHPDLQSRWLGGSSGWYDPYRNTTVPYDLDGHGTLVAGVVVGGAAGGSAIGVAPGARWIAAKIFRDDGLAVNSQILASLQWLLAGGVADVVNNSWGFEQVPGACDNTFRTAVQNLKAAGVAMIFSAGNAGPNLSTAVSPGNYAESLAVGAVDSRSVIASFSSRGPSTCDNSIYPELVAPGMGIRTADLSPRYATVSGTSFSAPHVSGVVALMLSAFPGLPVATVEETLKQTATDLGPAGGDNSYGLGLVNALAAFNQLSGVPHLAINDPVPPADDQQLDFGHLPPGTSAVRTVTVSNLGQGLLRITGLGAVPPPFSMVTDNCSGSAPLAAGGSCTFSLRFAPQEYRSFAAELVITSDDPEQLSVVFQLAGHGNTLPPAPLLVSPALGAINVPRPVTLEWSQPPDADGDPITHFVQLSERADFADTAPMRVAGSAANRPVLLAGIGAV
ncbi:MAG: S8 family serine peptidase, partial [Desulfuromonadales bacterium]|nr:S8 family serine peptidase [Desulfuromonadales bacterium]